MPSTYDPLLRLELQATGENANTWGDKANTDFTLAAQAIAGWISVAIGGSGTYTLSTASGATDEARYSFITLTGTLTGDRTIVIPQSGKSYYFRVATTGAYNVYLTTGAVGANTLTLSSTTVNHVVTDGTDVYFASETNRVSRAGDTMTGNLALVNGLPSVALVKTSASTEATLAGFVSAVPVWGVVPGDVNNAFSIDRYVAGSYVDSPISISNSTGQVGFNAGIVVSTTANVDTLNVNGDLTVYKTSPTFTLSKTSSGRTNTIIGKTSSLARWAVVLGDDTSETSSNIGSNFAISSWVDAGTYLETPLSITRSTGLTNLKALSVTNNVSVSGSITVNGVVSVSGSLYVGGSVSIANTVADKLGNVRSIPQNAQTSGYTLQSSDAGKHISISSGGVWVPAGIFSAGDAVVIYNNSGSSQLLGGDSVTIYLAGTSSTGFRTLALRGLCTLLCVGSNTYVITGAGLS